MLRNWLLIVLLCFSLPVAAAKDITLLLDLSSPEPALPTDMRLLALEHVIASLPEDAHVRFFGFGRYTARMTEDHVADAAWKKQTLLFLKKDIKFTARFSDLPLAVETAFDAWSTVPGLTKEIILISSGQVKLPRPQNWSDMLFRQLQGKNTRFSVLTLPNGNANEKLLAITKSTKGNFSEIENKKSLPITTKAIVQPALVEAEIPVENSRFYVDDSVKSMKIVLKTMPDSALPVLLGPGNLRINKAQSIANATWKDQGRQQILTIQNPKKGFWRIQAELSERPIVIAKTYFSLQVHEMPKEIFNHEKLTLQVALLRDKKLVKEAPLLEDMQFSATLVDKTGKMIQAVLNDDGQAKDLASDGIFTATFPVDASNGAAQIIVKATGSKLSRVVLAKTNIIETPVTTKIILPTSNKKPAQLLVVWNNLYATPDQKQTARIVSEMGEEQERTLLRVNRNTFLLTIPSTKVARLYDIYLNNVGKTQSGRDFSAISKPIRVAVAGDETLSSFLAEAGINGGGASAQHVAGSMPALPPPGSGAENIDLTKQKAEFISKITEEVTKKQKEAQEKTAAKLAEQAEMLSQQTNLLRKLMVQSEAKIKTAAMEQKADTQIRGYVPWVLLLVLINLLVAGVGAFYYLRSKKRQKTLDAMIHVLDNGPKT